jgi:RNase H-fold protein (predicted Holliday junction resolvase)
VVFLPYIVGLLSYINERRMVAFPYMGYRRTSLTDDRLRLARILEQESARGLVIGMPSAPSGHNCSVLREFIHAYSTALVFEQRVQIRVDEISQVDPLIAFPVGFADESYSTLLAREQVFEGTKRSIRRNSRLRKEAIDSVRLPRRSTKFGRLDLMEGDA